MENSHKSAGDGIVSGNAVHTGNGAHFGRAGSSGVSVLNVRQAAMILEQIACMAARLRELGHIIVQNESEDIELHGSTVAHLASQVGWLADLAAKKLNGNALLGEPEAWMLPPIYHDAQGEAGNTGSVDQVGGGAQ